MPTRDCCIVGAGPAGLMLGLLLARAGIGVTVVEKHADFLRDFRGDTIHPSTLEAMGQLGYLDEFLALPHQKAPALHAEIAGRTATIADFSRLPTRCKDLSQVHLLKVRMDRLRQWWKPGVLYIGDAAHAMSPIGAVGVNLAIQDAIAAANLLTGPLRDGTLGDRHLAAVQKRRAFPTKATQKVQLLMRRKRKPQDAGKPASGPPAFLRFIARSRLLPHLTGRLIGIGFRPEAIRL